jgi:tRNA pseudouridine38-40 synthase
MERVASGENLVPNRPFTKLTNWLVSYPKSRLLTTEIGRIGVEISPWGLETPDCAGKSAASGTLNAVTPLTDSAHADQALRNWKLTVAYDGTDFQGWQVQPGHSTIQGELQAALGRVTGESPLPQGSGRTDAGVHALAQVASFTLRAPIPAENLHRALNRTLPPSIRVLEATTVPSTFHARHSAIAKTYEYRIFRLGLCPPFLARYVYAYPWQLDMEKLQACARIFEGEHDFQSFAANDPDMSERSSAADELRDDATAPKIPVGSTTRTIYSSKWELRELELQGSVPRPSEAGAMLVYRVRGNGFLHHMVRNLVGTMLDVGRGQLALEEIPGILAARDRSAAGPTAPARGLFLHSVEYDKQVL